MKTSIRTNLSMSGVAILIALLILNLNVCLAADIPEEALSGCPRKVGFIQSRDSNTRQLLEGLTRFFPVHKLETVFLENNLADNTLDEVVAELEAVVMAMKSKDIFHILLSAPSSITGPFIEGTAGGLGGMHSDLRHPNVTFAATRQGTASVDNALNWYRPGADFRTQNLLSPVVTLPDVSGITPVPQFILGTDFSGAVDGQNAAYLQRAADAGYDVVAIDLQWNSSTFQFDNIAALSTAVSQAPPGSRVGLTLSDGDVPGHPPLPRFTDLTVQGLADPNLFDPENTNVKYLAINWIPFSGDFSDPGSLPVDLQIGVITDQEVIADPRGINHYLVSLGFPEEGLNDARAYDELNYSGVGVISAVAYAWLATCGQRNLDSRHTMDEARQYVSVYILDLSLPAGNNLFEVVNDNLRLNPRWVELNSRQIQFQD